MTLPTRVQTPAGRRTAYAGTILVVLVAVWIGGMLFAVVVGLAAAVTAVALGRMAGPRGQGPLTPVAVVLAAVISVSYHFTPEPREPENMEMLAAIPALIALLAAVVLLLAHRIRGLGAVILTTLCITALVGGTLFHAPLLRAFAFSLFAPGEGRWLVIAVMGVTIVSLAVARFVDRRGTSHAAAGARPTRTVKGAAAGVVAAVLFSVFLMPHPVGDDPITSAVISTTLGVTVQLGDLFHGRLSGRAGAIGATWTFPDRAALGLMVPLMWAVVVLYHWAAWLSFSMA